MDITKARLEYASLLHAVDVELSGHCNANCVFCPRDRMTREKTTLSRDRFEALLQEISDVRPEGPQMVYFCGFGEPLLNESLIGFADSVNRLFPDTLIVVVSNGGALNQDICDAILSSGIYAFTCSIQGIDKDRYEAAMRGPRFESVMRWMAYLAERRWESGLQVTVTYVRTDQTDREADEIHRFWNGLGIQVAENRLHNRGGFLESVKPDRPRNRKRCSLFNSRLFVAANGDVLACCQDLDGQSRLGTIGVDTISSILDRKMSMIRDKRLFPLCARCNDKIADI